MPKIWFNKAYAPMLTMSFFIHGAEIKKKTAEISQLHGFKTTTFLVKILSF